VTQLFYAVILMQAGFNIGLFVVGLVIYFAG